MMDSILDHIILDNTVKSYLIVAGVIILAILFKRYLSRYIAGLLFRLIQKMAKGVDKASFIGLVMAPLRTFLIILVTIVAFEKLHFPTTPFTLIGIEFEPNFTIYKISFKQLIETLSIVVLILSFVWLLLRIIDFVALILEHKANLTADQTDNQLIVFFKDFFKVLLVINGLLMILKFGFGFNIGSIITGLSIAGAALALATRESLENLIASFIIFFDKPFTVGDLVKVHNVTGTVEKIGLRSTRIRTDQKTWLTVPNKQMVDSILDNLSLRTQRRAFVQLELAAESDPEKLQQLVEVLKEKLKSMQPALENHAVFLADIHKNSFCINIEFFTGLLPIADFNELRQQFNLYTAQQLKVLGLQLADRGGESMPVKD